MWIGFEHSTPPAARLRAALARPRPQVHVFAPELDSRRYLPPLAENDFPAGGRLWQITSGSKLPDRVDILFVISTSADFLAPIWNLRRQVPQAVCLLWMWDNHHRYYQNLRTVLAVDGYFPCHSFSADYLLNPYSAHLGHVPMCCAQWRLPEIAAVLAAAPPRSDKFLAAYVNYGGEAHRPFLSRLQDVPQAELVLMSVPEWGRYFARTKAEQIAQWCSYKTSVVVPVERDLSLRMFDGLVCGQIPLVSDAVIDLDRVVAPEIQAALPILRFRDGDIPSLLAAHAEALRRFDAEGETGIRRRHDFVANGHMLHHRLAAMLWMLVALDTGRAGIAYHPPSAGLVLQALPETAAAPPHSADHPVA
jgi:hypothetical protein